MTSKFLLSILLLTASINAFGAKELISPKTRTIPIAPITEAVIDVLPGRAVKFIFPWVLNEDSDDLPFMISMSNDLYFNKPTVVKGQNVVVMTFKRIDKDMQNDITDLLISSHGYHFSFTLRNNFKPSKHYSTVVLEMTEADKLALIDKEMERVNQILIDEKERLENEIDDRAKVQALALVGGLSLDEPESDGIKEEAIKTLPNGDKIIAYVDAVENFGSFYNFLIEIENETNEAIYIKDIKLASVDKSGNKRLFPSSYLFPPKLMPSKTKTGTLSTLDFNIDDDYDHAVIFSTNKGEIEVIF